MIRKASENDAKEIAEIIVSSWKITYRGIISDDFLDNMSVEKMTNRWEENIKSPNESNNIYVYEEENKVLAIMRFGKVDNMQSKNGEIHVLYVKPDLKRNGIGTKLVNYAKQNLLKQGYKKMEIWCAKGNEPSIKFYEKMGGKIINTRISKVNGIDVDEVGFIYNLDETI